MLLNQETAKGGSQRNEEDYDFPSDIYLMRLDDVSEIPPKADDPTKTPRLVWEFSVQEGPYKGKKCSTFVRKNLFAGGTGPKGGNASGLFKLLRSLGVNDPMSGVDTTQLIGKLWRVGVKNETGRAWPESYYPATTGGNGQTGGAPRPPLPPPPGAAPTAPASEPSDESRWNVWDAHTQSYVIMTGKEIREYMVAQKMVPTSLSLCPEGTQDVRTADTYGFAGEPW